MIYLFYRDDSLTGWAFTMRTKHLTKCFEPLQAEGEAGYPLNRLKLPVILNYCPFQGGTSDAVFYVACFNVTFCAFFTLDGLDYI